MTVELPDAVHDILDQRSDPTLADDLVRAESDRSWPVQDVYTVMSNWGSNHAAMSYGHIGGN